MSSIQKQSNHHFSHTVTIKNLREAVWQFLKDVERWPEWDTELKSSELSGMFQEGSEGKLIPKTGPKLRFHISEIDPGYAYTFVTKMPIGTLDIKRTLESKNGQIYFTDEVWFTGFAKRIFGLFLGKGFKKSLPVVMENFKRLAEKENPSL